MSRITASDVIAFGAKGDGKQKDTAAIQSAIDARVRSGGGTVRFPPGKYLSGPLRLGSRVDLHLDPGATLLASTDVADYGAEPGSKGGAAFLQAQGARGISLTGMGTIHGQGTESLRGDQKPPFRIRLLQFDGCEDVRIRDLSFLYSDSWCLHLRRCERVWIDGITILNNVNRLNSDGIDPDSCRNVHISNCHIVAGDDCIVLKSTQPVPCENIVVTNCTLETTCTAIKLGTESHGDFRHIHVSNCVVRNTSSGIGFYLKDGATMEAITLANISYEESQNDPKRNAGCPLFMDIERRHPDSAVGTIRDVTISDFYARTCAGALIQGMPESPIQNLTLRNVHLRVGEPMDFSRRTKRIGGYRTTSDERDTLFARKPSYVTIAHVSGLDVRGLRVEIAEDVFRSQPRSALWLEHVEDASVRDVVRLPRDAAAAPVVQWRHRAGPSDRYAASGPETG